MMLRESGVSVGCMGRRLVSQQYDRVGNRWLDNTIYILGENRISELVDLELGPLLKNEKQFIKTDPWVSIKQIRDRCINTSHKFHILEVKL
jgi:hypothetical protein